MTVPRDTWKPKVFGGSPSQVAAINHGTYFYHAAMEGLLKNDTNIHAGIRTTLSGPSDYENDGYCGFEIVEAREIDTIGQNPLKQVTVVFEQYADMQQEPKESSRRSETESAPRTLSTSPLISIPLTLLVSFATMLSIPLLTMDSCTCNRNPRDWRLVDP